MAADRGTRERLLQAGVQMARAHGLRAITVRAVAAEAKVNLGSFVYHFGTREAFIGELIAHWYAPLIDRVDHLVAQLPLGATLRDLLLGIADWMLAEREFVGHLVMDAATGEPAARAFLKDNTRLPPTVVLGAIQMEQAAGRIGPGEPQHVLLMLLAAVGLPLLLFESLGAGDYLPEEFAGPWQAYTFSREHVAQRVDWVLKGVAP